MWKIGQKLVCIDDSGMYHSSGQPKKGEIYTFDGFSDQPAFNAFIFLKEFNFCNEFDIFRISYRATCFRPVDETFGESVAEKLEKEFISQPEPAFIPNIQVA